MKKIKVAWLHSHFLYWMGGTKFVFEVIKRLSESFDITVFVEGASPVVLNKYDQLNVPVRIIANRSSNDPFYWLMFPYYLRHELSTLKNELNNYDVLVSSMFPMNWLTAHFNLPKIQYCYEPFAFFHDPDFIDNLTGFKKYLTKLLSLIYKNMDIDATYKQDLILTLSDVTQKQIEKVYGKSSLVTYEGVDTDFFKPTKNTQIEDKYRGYKILIHCTDFSPIKGTRYVIESLPLILKKYPKTILLITSTIEDKKGIANMNKQLKLLRITKNVEFLGFVDFDLLPAYFSRADMLIHAGVGASGATTMSLPVKEALSCETPVVRSNDTEDEVQNGVSGYLVNPKNIQDCAGKVIKILADPKKAKQMGITGRKHIISKFTWDKVSDKIEQGILQAIETSNK